MPPRILIVEDNESFAVAVEHLLGGRGFHTERAADGVSALQQILASPPDLVLLDLQLPGLHGVELLRKLRAVPRTAQLPVIVMSGVYKGERYVQSVRSLGVEHYLEKPFAPQALLTAIQASLGPRTAPPQESAKAASGFDRHLSRAFLRRFSGQLVLRTPDSHHALIFFNGAPVELQPAFRHRNFGEYLLKQGIIGQQEYDYYAESAELRHEIFVQMGCLGYAELLERKFAFLASELVAAFAAPQMTAEEIPFAAPPGLQVITVNMPEVFFQGYQTLFTPERSKRYLEQTGTRFAALAHPYYDLINFLRLAEEERRLLLRLDGSVPLHTAVDGNLSLIPLLYTLQVLGMIRMEGTPLAAASLPTYPLRTLFNALEEVELTLPEETLESFTDLTELTADFAESSPPPAPQSAPQPEISSLGDKVRSTHARLQGKNYYEVFGLTQGNYAFEKLKENYFAITREFGPDVLMQLGGEEAGLVEEILSTVTNAYNTLSDVVKKEKYDQLLGADRIGLGHKGDDRFQAQVQSQSGKVFIDMEEWDNAEKALQDACGIEPENGDYLAHLAWAIYRNPRYASSRATLDKAKQMLNRSISLERTAPAFAFKGWIMLEVGQDNLAEMEFNKALKLDARNLLARKGLKAVQERREQQKKGLFGRMFGA